MGMGNTSYVMEIYRMAHFIRDKNGMAYTLPADPVIKDEATCPDVCMTIDSRQVLRQPHE